MNRTRNRIASIALRIWLRGAERRMGNFVVTGYPKSGTTWVTQLMARLAGVDFKQGSVRFRFKGVALHTHGVNFEGKNNLLYVVRDPRETVCSAARAAKARNLPDVHNEDGTITDAYVKHAITTLPGARVTMREHLQAGIDGGWTFVCFEDLKADAQKEMKRLVNAFDLDSSPQEIAAAIAEFDFEKQRKRYKGNAFFAQSSLASWKNLLSPVSLDLLESEVGEQACVFGYDLSQRG